MRNLNRTKVNKFIKKSKILALACFGLCPDTLQCVRRIALEVCLMAGKSFKMYYICRYFKLL